MSRIVSCTCGARVRLPEGSTAAAFRCPRCKADIAVPVEAKVVASSVAQAGGVGAVCPICQSAVADGEAVLTCPECEQLHHRDCWTEVGGCSTYGCKQAPVLTKPDAPPDRPLTAWGDTKRCPACGEEIKSIALRCRYCGTDFETVDPLSVRDLKRGAKKEKDIKTLQQQIVALFVMSMIGCLAPLSLLLSLLLILPKRHLLTRAGPIYVVLGYAAIGLSIFYSFLMGAFGIYAVLH